MAVEKMYTLTEVIEMMGISRRTFYRYIDDGSIKAVMIARRWYVKESDLQNFMNKGTGTIEELKAKAELKAAAEGE